MKFVWCKKIYIVFDKNQEHLFYYHVKSITHFLPYEFHDINCNFNT